MPMDDEELPKKKPTYPPASFDPLGVEELSDYIVWLKEQIQLAENAIAKKKAAQHAAQAFFKSST